MDSSNKQLKEDCSNLDFDIIRNVLSRLPVKPLFRFKSVCKPWYSIISHVEFAKVHLLQSKKSDCEVRVLYRTISEPHDFHQFKFRNHGLQYGGMLEFPVKEFGKAVALCSNDGLVLLKDFGRRDQIYVIWNPSTRTYTTFSCPYRFRHAFTTAGIYYNQANGDSKVLLLEDDSYAVFSYRKNCWSEKTLLSSTRDLPYNELVVVHGVPHWVVIDKCGEDGVGVKEKRHKEELFHKECVKSSCSLYPPHFVNHPVYECSYESSCEICYLDPINDNVKRLPKPVSLDGTCAFRLTSLRNQLCLYRKTYDITKMEIWIMEEYGNPVSWTKLLIIEDIPAPHKCFHAKPLCFTSESDVVIDFLASEFVIYSPSDKKFGEIRRYCNAGSPLLFMESLELPRRIGGSMGNQSEMGI